MIISVAGFCDTDSGPGLDFVRNQAREAFSAVDIDLPADAGANTSAPEMPAPAALPWKTVAGGAGGLAAAAIALAGLALGSTATARGKRPDKRDRDKVIGYILQLSAERLRIAAKEAAPLTVSVWEVRGDGSYREAAATVNLMPPPGVSVQPETGPSPCTTSVWQSASAPAGASLTVGAQAASGATKTTVVLETEGADALLLALEPAGKRLKADGKDSVKLVATLQISPATQADPAFDFSASRASIEFSAGEWADFGVAADTATGRETIVGASQPDANHPVAPPESVVVSVRATIGEREFSKSLPVPISVPPVIDAKPDQLRFSAGTGATADVLVQVEPAGEVEWTVTHKLAENDRAVVTAEVHRTSAASATVRVTESAGELPPSDAPSEGATLRIIAEADGFEPLERHVRVSIAREGVYVDATGRDPDGTFHILADGSGRVTEIDVRVFARDPATGEVAFDPTLSQTLSIEPAEDTGSRGALRYAEIAHERAGIRPSNSPSAIHRFRTTKVLPTAGKPIAASYLFSVDDRDEPAFSATVPISLLGIDMEPFSRGMADRVRPLQAHHRALRSGRRSGPPAAHAERAGQDDGCRGALRTAQTHLVLR